MQYLYHEDRNTADLIKSGNRFLPYLYSKDDSASLVGTDHTVVQTKSNIWTLANLEKLATAITIVRQLEPLISTLAVALDADHNSAADVSRHIIRHGGHPHLFNPRSVAGMLAYDKVSAGQITKMNYRVPANIKSLTPQQEEEYTKIWNAGVMASVGIQPPLVPPWPISESQVPAPKFGLPAGIDYSAQEDIAIASKLANAIPYIGAILSAVATIVGMFIGPGIPKWTTFWKHATGSTFSHIKLNWLRGKIRQAVRMLHASASASKKDQPGATIDNATAHTFIRDCKMWQMLTGIDFSPLMAAVWQMKTQAVTIPHDFADVVIERFVPYNEIPGEIYKPLHMSKNNKAAAITDSDTHEYLYEAVNDVTAMFEDIGKYGWHGGRIMGRQAFCKETSFTHDADCTACKHDNGAGPGFSDFSIPRSGPIYHSNLISASMTQLPRGTFGITYLDTSPMRIEITNQTSPIRARIALAHELMHVADEVYKLNLSHDQVHNLGVFLTAEALPALARLG